MRVAVFACVTDKTGYVLYGGLVVAKSPTSCRCGHPYAAHEHLRPGTECVTCPAGDCARYRPLRWWHRDPWTFFALRRGAGGVLAEGAGPALGHRAALPADDRAGRLPGPRGLGAAVPGEVRDAGTRDSGTRRAVPDG